MAVCHVKKESSVFVDQGKNIPKKNRQIARTALWIESGYRLCILDY